MNLTIRAILANFSSLFDQKRPNIGIYGQNLGIAYDIHTKGVKLCRKVVLIAYLRYGT